MDGSKLIENELQKKRINYFGVNITSKKVIVYKNQGYSIKCKTASFNLHLQRQIRNYLTLDDFKEP